MKEYKLKTWYPSLPTEWIFDDKKFEFPIIVVERENAEKFIRDNKKMYTLKDMVRIANHWAYIKSVTPEVAKKVIDKWKQ